MCRLGMQLTIKISPATNYFLPTYLTAFRRISEKIKYLNRLKILILIVLMDFIKVFHLGINNRYFLKNLEKYIFFNLFTNYFIPSKAFHRQLEKFHLGIRYES